MPYTLEEGGACPLKGGGVCPLEGDGACPLEGGASGGSYDGGDGYDDVKSHCEGAP